MHGPRVRFADRPREPLPSAPAVRQLHVDPSEQRRAVRAGQTACAARALQIRECASLAPASRGCCWPRGVRLLAPGSNMPVRSRMRVRRSRIWIVAPCDANEPRGGRRPSAADLRTTQSRRLRARWLLGSFRDSLLPIGCRADQRIGSPGNLSSNRSSSSGTLSGFISSW